MDLVGGGSVINGATPSSFPLPPSLWAMLYQDYPDRECQAEDSTKRPHQGGGCTQHRAQITTWELVLLSSNYQASQKVTLKNLDNKEEAKITLDKCLDFNKNCYKYFQKLSNIIAAV